MKISSGILVSFLALSGCTNRVVTADLPVYSPPAVNLPAKPILACPLLKNNSTPMQVQKAEVSDIYSLIEYSEELNNILTPLANKTGSSPSSPDLLPTALQPHSR